MRHPKLAHILVKVKKLRFEIIALIASRRLVTTADSRDNSG